MKFIKMINNLEDTNNIDEGSVIKCSNSIMYINKPSVKDKDVIKNKIINKENTINEPLQYKVGDILYKKNHPVAVCVIPSNKSKSGKNIFCSLYDLSESIFKLKTNTRIWYWGVNKNNILDLSNYKLPFYQTENEVLNDYNGKINSKNIIKIIKKINDIDELFVGYGACAVYGCSLYKIDGINKGSWYLPSIGELKELYNNKDIINNVLKTIEGASILLDEAYWGSSLYNNEFVWGIIMGNGTIGCNRLNSKNYVRPFLEL